MDTLLAQAARYSAGLALRSGISIAGGFAIRQVATYISKVPENSHKQELELTSRRLDQKIKIITPAIDLIEIIAARGNTTLNSTVQLTVSLRNDINAFGQRMSEVMSGAATDNTSPAAKDSTRRIIDDMRSLMARIEDAVPLISLALTTSGANLSATLPNTVSPSRLLQASTFLQEADTRFDALSAQREIQVGPSFSLKLYTIFEGHSRQSQDPNVTNITWQETYARAILEVIRVPMAEDSDHDEDYAQDHKIRYLYHFRVTENLNDGRYHEEIERGTYRRDHQGFIRGASRDIPVHNVARLFFSASGRLLNIEEARTPVLVLKINHGLKGPSAMIRAIFANLADQDTSDSGEAVNGQEATSPDDLEWIALELWAEDEEPDSDLDNFDTASEASSTEGEEAQPPAEEGPRPATAAFSDVDDLAMQLQVLDMSQSVTISQRTGKAHSEVATLSLLEYILRLSALQTSEQESVLSISDERISLFLRDDASQSRSKSRQEAEAVRRSSTDRFDTPASSVYYDEFIPGTQVKSRKSRRSRQGTPVSNSSTPTGTLQSRNVHNGFPKAQQTPQSALSIGQAPIDHASLQRWHHTGLNTLQKTDGLDSPSASKSSLQKHPSNLFQVSNDLKTTTNNGFSSRLRHSVQSPDNTKSVKRSNGGADDKHKIYMSSAIEEARKSEYISSAFCVGCVIVKHDKVISTGFSRELEGNTHAEQCALDKLQDIEEAEGADMYTTMEPCSVRLSGNLPCVQRIIAAKIARVYQAVKEPADFVECNGVDLLRRANIEVHTVPGFEEEAIAIARGES